MHGRLRSALTFAGMGLVGPLIRLATWPPSRFEAIVPSWVSKFVYDLVLLLWPTQPLAAIEANVGWVAAASLTVCANVAFFAMLGAVVGRSGKTRGRRIGIYFALCAIICSFELWVAGFSWAYLNGWALMVALFLYAIPFWVMKRASETS